MQDIGMKIAISLAVAIAILTSLPLLAQQPQATGSADASGKVTYETASGGFGDLSASHAWEMSSITGELDGKLDSKTAKVGDRVVLKTTNKVQTSDGTLIPKGSRLIGHITQVQPYSKEHGAAALGIAFDQVEMKGGQSVAIYTLIRGVSPNPSAMAISSMDNDGSFGAPMGAVPAMSGGPVMGGGRGNGGLIGGAGGTLNGAGSVAGGVTGGAIDSAGAATSSIGDQGGSSIGNQAGAGLGSAADSKVETAGHGDLDVEANPHQAAAIRAVPRSTRIPGLMLAGNSSASGLLLGARRDISLQSGTQIQLGIVAR
jgi:hypothetical protein